MMMMLMTGTVRSSTMRSRPVDVRRVLGETATTWRCDGRAVRHRRRCLGPACWAATRLGGRETKLVYLKLGAILNTAQGSLVLDMTYNVFGGTLNPAQSNPIQSSLSLTGWDLSGSRVTLLSRASSSSAETGNDVTPSPSSDFRCARTPPEAGTSQSADCDSASADDDDDDGGVSTCGILRH